jgi:hypothetical protein
MGEVEENICKSNTHAVAGAWSRAGGLPCEGLQCQQLVRGRMFLLTSAKKDTFLLPHTNKNICQCHLCLNSAGDKQRLSQAFDNPRHGTLAKWVKSCD